MHISLLYPADSTASSNAHWRPFAEALAAALEARGCTVITADYAGRDPGAPAADVQIVLADQWLPSAPDRDAGLRFVWLLGYPENVSAAELEGYDLVLTASRLHADLLAARIAVPVRLALPCTDAARCPAPEEGGGSGAESAREGVVYVEDADRGRDTMAQWLFEARVPARVFGSGWSVWDIGHFVEAEYVAPDERAALYRQATFGLVGHEARNRAFGYGDKRVLDSLACGLPVVTEDVPGLRNEFGDAVIPVGGPEELRQALAMSEDRYNGVLEAVRETWARVGYRFSWHTRAGDILGWIEQPPGIGQPSSGFAPEAARDAEHALAHTVDTMQRRRAVLEEQLGACRRQYEQAREREAAARGDAQEQQARAVEAEAERLALQRRLDEIESSTSWRVTRPLRIGKRRLREMRGAAPGDADTSGARRDGGTASNAYAGGGTNPSRRWVPRFVITAWRGATSDAASRTAPPGRVRRLVRRTIPRPVRGTLRDALARLGLKNAVTGNAGSQGGGTSARQRSGGSREQSAGGDVHYWRLQAIQLLEELEHERVDANTSTPSSVHDEQRG